MLEGFTDYKYYLPWYLGLARWGVFVICKGVPYFLYRPYTMEDIDKGKSKNADAYEEHTFTGEDVTLVIPVYEIPATFKDNLISLLNNKPFQIIVVADKTCYEEVLAIVNGLDAQNILVVNEERPGKRAAMVSGLKLSTTSITCFVDDDCQWCPTLLDNMIIPFNVKKIGGVGVRQTMRANGLRLIPNIQEIMADMRLSARYLEINATSIIDGGVSCISGRTACYKTAILQNEDFYDKFLNEKFFGMQLQSGDDKFLTRYLIVNGWKTYHQLSKGCTLTTTFESGWKHYLQLVRWSRNTWRSDLTALFIERKIWFNNPFTALMLFDKILTPFFLIYGLMALPISSIVKRDYALFICWVIWLLVSRALKLIVHLANKPIDIIYVPVYVIYNYFMGVVRIYALLTIQNRMWGSRAVGVVGNQVVRIESPKEQVRTPDATVIDIPPEPIVANDSHEEALQEDVHTEEMIECDFCDKFVPVSEMDEHLANVHNIKKKAKKQPPSTGFVEIKLD